MADNKRLIICLDGTWNRQDNSTNVLHHFNVVHEGLDPKTGMDQKKYYHPGVGTGPLDRITGGGFGIGLEQNVRDAYNWLVGNYCDDPADEIYIFGFSRGAYTARSLVGFIGRCGLLRRGAPITVDQLWDDYCILGRQKEERTSVWDWLLWKEQPKIRQITELTSDPWSKKPYRAPDLTKSEELLLRWSRRVRITYLGVFDTVGSIGWDALAIPGLTSRMALHNNMRPSTLIQHCRHALALDENRANFNHTPFLAYVGYDLKEAERAEDSDADDTAAGTAVYWKRQRAMWQRKIKQCWFVGAHSNIGGGYEDNRLAQRPLHWILEGATDLGMVADAVPIPDPVTREQQIPRDSYEEFAPPLWTKIIRAKRNFRMIDPPAVPQAGAPKPGVAEPAGFSLETIHETVDDSVVEYWKNSPVPLAPNLQEYAQRKRISIPGAKPAAHEWVADQVKEYMAVMAWATVAVAGLFAVFALIGYAPSDASAIKIACLMAFFLPLVDWGESKANFQTALGRGGPPWRAFLDAIFWTRLLAFVLFLFGAVYGTVGLVHLGWIKCSPKLLALGLIYGPAAVSAAAATLLLARLRAKAWASLVLGPAAVTLTAGALYAVGRFAVGLFPELSKGPCTSAMSAIELSKPGLLLLLQLALLYFWRAMVWVDDPMAKANLGSIVPLQKCPTPAKVAACLERWRSMLECRWRPEDEDKVKGPAAVQMRELVGVCLWRDIIGFIPVYTLVFIFGLWFAQYFKLPGFDFLNWPKGFALWWSLPLLAATADYLEDICHLRFRKLHAMGRIPPAPSAPLAFFSWSMSKIKDVAWVIAGVLTAAAVFVGTWEVRPLLPDWRAKIALLIAVTTLLLLLALLIARVCHYFVVKGGKHSHPGTSGPPPHAPVSAMPGK